MIIYLYIFLILLNLISCSLNKKIKHLDLFVLAGISILMGRGAVTLDTYNYESSYQYSIYEYFSDTYEPGYLLLEKIGNLLNLDYISFRILLTFLCFLLIRNSINKLTNNPHYVYLCCMIFLIFIDTEQIRSFYAFSIIIYGFQFLISEKSKGTYKFLLLTLIASTIHISALSYILFILTKFRNKRALIWTIISITLISCVLIFVVGSNLSFLRLIISNIDNETNRLQGYVEGKTNLGFIYAFTLHLFNLALVFLARKQLKRNVKLGLYKDDYNDLVKNESVIELVFWINMLCILFFPLYMLNLQFIRLARNLIALNLLAISLIQKPFFNFHRLTPRIMFVNFMVLINLMYWFYYTFITQDHIDDIIIPFFDISTI